MQILINGLIAGSLYALVATGFSLNYSVSKFSNFSYGAIIVLSGYFLYLFYSCLHIPFSISVLLVLLTSIIFGLFVHFLLWKPMRFRKVSNIMMIIVSLSLAILLESLIQMIFGANVKTIGFLSISKGYDFLGGVITPLQVIILLIVVVLFGILWYIFKKTQIGKSMRALSNNYDLAKVYGLQPEKIYLRTTILISILAGIGGILIALEQNLDPSMGIGLIIKGFTGAVIGNMLSVPGSILGAFILGLAENFGIRFLPSGYKDAIAFVLLFFFLLIKPSGIFAKHIRNS